jgi:hypothetical protein
MQALERNKLKKKPLSVCWLSSHFSVRQIRKRKSAYKSFIKHDWFQVFGNDPMQALKGS